MKRAAALFFEELAPQKRRLRAAGGFGALPQGVLEEIVGYLLPAEWLDGRDRFVQQRRMAGRMFENLAHNHEAAPLARDALALLGSCRLLRFDRLYANVYVFQVMLQRVFVEHCLEHLFRNRCAQHELRSLQITLERMAPAAARRHALEQALLRPAVRASTSRHRCNHHVARGAGLNRVSRQPLPGKLEDVEVEDGEVRRLLV